MPYNWWCDTCLSPYEERNQGKCLNYPCKGELRKWWCKECFKPHKQYATIKGQCRQCNGDLLLSPRVMDPTGSKMRWWCKQCCKLQRHYSDGECVECGGEVTMMHGEVVVKAQSTPHWICQICFVRLPPEFKLRNEGRCPSCNSIGSMSLEDIELDEQWGELMGIVPLQSAKMWAQGRSFKAVDPLLATGFCNSFAMHWLSMRMKGVNFWNWIQTPSSQVAIMNLHNILCGRMPQGVWDQSRVDAMKQLNPRWWQNPDDGTWHKWSGSSNVREIEPVQGVIPLWKRKSKEPYAEIPEQVEVLYTITQWTDDDGQDSVGLTIQNAPEVLIEKLSYDNPMRVNKRGEVTVPAGSSFRNTFMAERQKVKAKRKKKQQALSGDEGKRQAALDKMVNDRLAEAPALEEKLNALGLTMSNQTVARGKTAAINAILMSRHYKLVSLLAGGSGHAVAADVYADTIYYLDPNKGEYVLSHNSFRDFFQVMCPEKYTTFLIRELRAFYPEYQE